LTFRSGQARLDGTGPDRHLTRCFPQRPHAATAAISGLAGVVRSRLWDRSPKSGSGLTLSPSTSTGACGEPSRHARATIGRRANWLSAAGWNVPIRYILLALPFETPAAIGGRPL